MPGGVNQLALFGKEDLVLSGQPEITFFRSKHKRYSVFSLESILAPFQSEATFGRRTVLPITRSGDLVYSVFLEVDLPDLRDFAIETVTPAASAVPGIVSARWESSTTANIRIIPSLDGADDSYDVLVDDGTTQVTVNGAAGATDVPITALDKTKSYSISVRRVASGTPGSYSTTVAVSSVRWCNSIGHALCKTVDFEIGGARVSRITSEWMDVDAELSLPSEKEEGFNTMIGKFPNYDLWDQSLQGPTKLFIPLNFSWCRNPGLSLPIVQLVYHTMNLVFDIREYNELIKSTVPVSSLVNQTGRTPSLDIQAYITYVFLSTQERKKFLENSHELLLQNVQFLGDTPVIVSGSENSLQRKYDLNFVHPVSEILWTYNAAAKYNSGITPSQYPVQGNDYFDYEAPGGAVDPIAKAVIHVNGHARYAERSGKYHRLLQPYGHHTRIPNKKVYCYSFALQPEAESSPSGSINLSRADTAHLQVTFDPSFSQGASDGRLRVYARTLNVLRFSGGMGTLLFTST